MGSLTRVKKTATVTDVRLSLARGSVEARLTLFKVICVPCISADLSVDLIGRSKGARVSEEYSLVGIVGLELEIISGIFQYSISVSTF